jgi:hypothetical protein
MDELEDTISIKSNIASVGFKSFGLKNQFMGFADFRAAFTSETSVNWTIEPTEGALKKSEETEFVIRCVRERGRPVTTHSLTSLPLAQVQAGPGGHERRLPGHRDGGL